jgi:hypothetical protein
LPVEDRSSLHSGGQRYDPYVLGEAKRVDIQAAADQARRARSK